MRNQKVLFSTQRRELLQFVTMDKQTHVRDKLGRD